MSDGERVACSCGVEMCVHSVRWKRGGGEEAERCACGERGEARSGYGGVVLVRKGEW